MSAQLAKLAQYPVARSLLLLILGASNTLGFAPFSISVVPILSFILFAYVATDTKSVKSAFKDGFIYGLGWFGAGISWVHVSIDTYGGMPLIISLLLMFLLVGYLSLYPALAVGLSKRLSSNKLQFLLLLSPLWLVTEWLRGWILTGFPWLSLGYSQLNGPLHVYAPIVGEIGISWLLTFLSCLLIIYYKNLVSRKRLTISAIFFITLTLGLNFVDWVKPTNEVVKTTLVQGNIKQELRWAPEQHWPTMLKYLDLTRPHYQSDLIIWPEAAIPEIEPLAQDYLNNLNKSLNFNETALVTGIIDVNLQTHKVFNNLVVVGQKFPQDSSETYFYGHANRYNKHHLLPIGEFIPFEDVLRGISPLFDLPMSSFTRGDYIQPPLIANGYQITPALCYEIAFVNQILDNFDNDTQSLLTVSNDAWFGSSHGPHQHMEIAQMRALELGRPLLRATNNGVTGVVDAHGQIMAKLPQFEDGVLNTEVTLVEGSTPYSVMGNKPIILINIFLLLVILLRQRIMKANS